MAATFEYNRQSISWIESVRSPPLAQGDASSRRDDRPMQDTPFGGVVGA